MKKSMKNEKSKGKNQSHSRAYLRVNSDPIYLKYENQDAVFPLKQPVKSSCNQNGHTSEDWEYFLYSISPHLYQQPLEHLQLDTPKAEQPQPKLTTSWTPNRECSLSHVLRLEIWTSASTHRSSSSPKANHPSSHVSTAWICSFIPTATIPVQTTITTYQIISLKVWSNMSTFLDSRDYHWRKKSHLLLLEC